MGNFSYCSQVECNHNRRCVPLLFYLLACGHNICWHCSLNCVREEKKVITCGRCKTLTLLSGEFNPRSIKFAKSTNRAHVIKMSNHLLIDELPINRYAFGRLFANGSVEALSVLKLGNKSSDGEYVIQILFCHFNENKMLTLC